MKSLGKHEVLIESFVNGASTVAFWDRLTVYEKADGTLWINSMKMRKQITRKPDGTLYYASHITKVAVTSPTELFAKIREAVERDATENMAKLKAMGLIPED